MAARLTLYPKLVHPSPPRFNFQPRIDILPFRIRGTSSSYLQASRRFSTFPQEGDKLVDDSRYRSQRRGGRVGIELGGYDFDEDEDEDEEDEDRSLDLLIKFVQNVFRKISRKARKAVRSVLPVAISSQLVGFSVNGVIILTFLWVLKALLEVICTLGSVVFASILLIRGIWTGISYLQDTRNHRIDDEDHTVWTGAQPAS
ncbi:PREDICTED: uncharacterized protein LOC109164650 [Ipomoea nil]|uniref:uncharacterized protein LOC109164650 n=1 Tax=Ipomoea nil TaxID=35883 RepID=UPI0009012AD2|nr:PREDICTED: uncharacterized protein LOC109164650 [Ipomoea nil]